MTDTPYAVFDSGQTFHRLTCKLVPTDKILAALGTVPLSFALKHGVKPCAECRPEEKNPS